MNSVNSSMLSHLLKYSAINLPGIGGFSELNLVITSPDSVIGGSMIGKQSNNSLKVPDKLFFIIQQRYCFVFATHRILRKFTISLETVIRINLNTVL